MKLNRIIISVFILLITQSVFAFEIVELKIPKSDKIVVKLMFRNGSVSDPVGMEGLTQLTSNLMSESGTGNYTSADIKSITYPWAAGWYVSVDKEVSVFTFEFHKDHADKFIPILTGLIASPRFEEKDFSRIKSNQENYVNQVIRSSSDEELSKMALEDQLFRGSLYAHLVSGSTAGLASIQLSDVIRHHKTWFTSENLMVGIAGNYSSENLTQLTDLLKQLPVNPPPAIAPSAARLPDGIQVQIVTKSKSLGSAIFTGFPLAITRRNDEFAALMVANSWLGEHRKSYSRLYQKIREQRSMNYGDYSYIEWYNNGGSNMVPQPGYPRNSNYFSLWIRPVQTAASLKNQYAELKDISIGHAFFAIRMAVNEINQMIQNGMSQEDFQQTRDFLKSYSKLYIQTPSRKLGYMMDSKFYGRTDYITELDGLLSKLTLDDVNKAIRKYWQTGNMFITIVTDKTEAEPLKEYLLNGTPSPMTYSDVLRQTLPEELLDEDARVSKIPFKAAAVDIISDQDLFRK